MNGEVGWAGLATSLALVGFAAAISLWQRLGLERQVVWSAIRALVQLLLVGSALALLFEPGRSLWWSWAWTAGMVGYAGDVARRRAPEVPGWRRWPSPRFATAAVVTLGVIFGVAGVSVAAADPGADRGDDDRQLDDRHGAGGPPAGR